MTKKSKIIGLISFLLFLVPFVTSAGCYGPKAIISSNNIDSDCIDAITYPCGGISIKNRCKESFFYYTKTGAVIDYLPLAIDNSEFSSIAKSLVNDNFVEIPPNWNLDINDNGSVSLCSQVYSGNPCFPVIYKNIASSNNFLLKFGKDKMERRYTITGYYQELHETEYDKNFRLEQRKSKYIVFFLFIFILSFLPLCFIVNKYKTKHIKRS